MKIINNNIKSSMKMLLKIKTYYGVESSIHNIQNILSDVVDKLNDIMKWSGATK